MQIRNTYLQYNEVYCSVSLPAVRTEVVKMLITFADNLGQQRITHLLWH